MEISKEVKDLGNSNIQLDVTVAKSHVKEAYDSTLTKYVKTAQIPGFRKGKVPASILENRFGESLRMETAFDIIEKALEEVFETADKNIKPLRYSQPELASEPKLDPEKEFQFSVKYDVYPTVDLKTKGGFTLKSVEVFGEDDALEEELKNIQQNNAFVIDRKEGETAQKGDVVTIDYCEIDEDEKTIENSQRQDFVFEIGTGENLYKIDDDLVGMKKDEEKVIKKEFPADFENKDLAGQSKNIKVKLTALKFRDLPEIDDELAKDVSEKYETLDDLKTDLKEKIAKAIENKIKNTKIEAYLDAVIDANDFVVPESMIQAELNLYWANMARQMGVSVEKLDQIMGTMEDSKSAKDNFFENTRPSSIKELKKQIITQALIESEPDILANPEEIEKKYIDIAEETGMEVAEVKKAYENQEYQQYLSDMIAQEKLFDHMLEKCKFEVGEKVTASEFLRRQR